MNLIKKFNDWRYYRWKEFVQSRIKGNALLEYPVLTWLELVGDRVNKEQGFGAATNAFREWVENLENVFIPVVDQYGDEVPRDLVQMPSVGTLKLFRDTTMGIYNSRWYLVDGWGLCYDWHEAEFNTPGLSGYYPLSQKTIQPKLGQVTRVDDALKGLDKQLGFYVKEAECQLSTSP